MDRQPLAQTSKTTSFAHPRRADLVIRAGAIHSMTQQRTFYRAIAIRDERIVALTGDPHGLDALLADGTRLLDDPGLTLLPALYDTHNHLLEAARNVSMVAVDQARSIADLVELIRKRAAQTPAGQWIRTTNAWNESNLAERRLPTAAELDAATTQHPVLVRRGGHNGVANSEALRLAGITAQSPNPPGGSYGRLADGTPNGILDGGAVYVVAALIPPASFEEQVAGLSQASSVFAAQGIGIVRDPLIQRDELLVYQAAWERGQHSARCRPMVVVTPLAGSASVADRIALIEGLGVRSGFGDARLRIWGLKFVMDGGVEGAALEEPFTAGPAGSGHLNWTPDDMVAVANVAVRRGWRLGTHAAGDKATRTVLEVYERVIHDNPGLRPGSLVLEHAILASAEQRARAIRLGIPVTVQHPLLYAQGAAMLKLWGPQRAQVAMPVRAWIDEGAHVSAGSDYPAAGYDAMRSIWGLVTRDTEGARVLGADQGIDQHTAYWPYSAAGAQLDGESHLRGTLAPGLLADVTAFRADPLTCPLDDLRALRPAFTMVGGRPTYDPDGRLGTAGA